MRSLALIVLILTAFSASAQLGGQTVFNSLNIQGSARVAALGGNYFAVKDGDINIASSNPSIIDSSMHRKVSFSYVDYFAKTNFGYATYGHKLNSKWTAVGTMQFISHGKMDELDPLGNNIGSFSAGEYSLILGTSYKMDSLWSFGANLKTIYSNIDSYYSIGLATDFAVTYYKPTKRFVAAGIIKNIGTQLHTFTEGTREKLPFEMQISISKRPQHAPFRFSLVYENLQKWDLTYVNPNATLVTDPITGEIIEEKKFEFGDQLMRHLVFGTEFLLSESFNFRVGYNYRRRQELKLQDKPAMAGISFGLGIKVKRMDISYARAIYHAAGPANHFTFAFRV